jgi:hypothetical protein
MNRRKAISLVALTGLGTTLAGGAYKWWTLFRTPDLAYLSQNRALLDALGEAIIPTTGSPGARAAGVTDFIIAMVGDCMPRKEQNTFIGGLRDLQSWCRNKYDKPFEQCSPADQNAVLSAFEKKGRPYPGRAGKIELRLTGRPFFEMLKSYTVEGYCTSRPGATQGLVYIPVPGAYQPCIPLQPGQKAWATS